MIQEQIRLFGAALGFGWAIGFIYCILSRLDAWFHIHSWIRGIRDILYGCAAGFMMYSLLLYMDDGILHGYAVVGVAAGWLISFWCCRLFEILKKRLTHRKE